MSHINLKRSISLIAAILLLLAGLTSNIAGAAVNVGTAVNKAGQQRMLTQRIVKAYFMMASDINADEAKKQLDASVGLFEQNLMMLQDFSPNKEIKKALDDVENIWLDFRMTALSNVDSKVAKKFLEDGDELLGKCQNVVDKITEYSGAHSAKIVDVSGKQRMLSQRIAKYYVAYYFGLKDGTIVERMNKAVQEFDAALRMLDDYSGNTGEINDKLRKVHAQWMFAKKGLEGFPNDDELKPYIIAVSMDSVMTKMNELTGDYASLADKVASAK